MAPVQFLQEKGEVPGTGSCGRVNSEVGGGAPDARKTCGEADVQTKARYPALVTCGNTEDQVEREVHSARDLWRSPLTDTHMKKDGRRIQR